MRKPTMWFPNRFDTKRAYAVSWFSHEAVQVLDLLVECMNFPRNCAAGLCVVFTIAKHGYLVPGKVICNRHIKNEIKKSNN